MTHTSLTVGDVRNTNFCASSCNPTCFSDDHVEITPYQKLISKCSLVAFISFVCLQGIPGIYFNKNCYLSGFIPGCVIGFVGGTTFNIALRVREGPCYGFSHVFEKISECHAAKNACVKIFLAAIFAGLIVLRATPPYENQMQCAGVTAYDGLFPGIMMGIMTSELTAYQLTRLLQCVGLLSNLEESAPLLDSPPRPEGRELLERPKENV